MAGKLQRACWRLQVMNKRNWKELLALTMIGDGVLTAINPQRHLALWRFGPKPGVRALDSFIKRPRLTRVLGVAAAGAGIWWASRQKPARMSLFKRSA
jgi:hypothetical protein